MTLTFPRQIRGWDLRRNVVNFLGEDDGSPTQCAITMEALVDHFGATARTRQACLAAYDQWRSSIQQKASDKHDAQDRTGVVLLRSADFP